MTRKRTYNTARNSLLKIDEDKLRLSLLTKIYYYSYEIIKF